MLSKIRTRYRGRVMWLKRPFSLIVTLARYLAGALLKAKRRAHKAYTQRLVERRNLEAHRLKKQREREAHHLRKKQQLEAHLLKKQREREAIELKQEAHRLKKEGALEAHRFKKEPELAAHRLKKERELEAHHLRKKQEQEEALRRAKGAENQSSISAGWQGCQNCGSQAIAWNDHSGAPPRWQCARCSSWI